jgi:hypothetical protein
MVFDEASGLQDIPAFQRITDPNALEDAEPLQEYP